MKTTWNKKRSVSISIGRSKLNCIESTTSQALIDVEISPKEYTTIINEEEMFRRLKDDVRMVKSERSDPEKDKLLEEDKKIGINVETHGGKKKTFFKTFKNN